MSTRATASRTGFFWPVGLRSRVARVFDIQTSSSHAEVGLSWDRKYWATASLRLLLIYLRGCTPSKTQYRPNVVHSSPAQPGVLPGFGSRRDILKTRLMVQCDLIFSFPRALCDFPYCVHLKREVLTHRIEVPSVPDKSWFVGPYPEWEVYARSGLGLGVRYRRPCR